MVWAREGGRGVGSIELPNPAGETVGPPPGAGNGAAASCPFAGVAGAKRAQKPGRDWPGFFASPTDCYVMPPEGGRLRCERPLSLQTEGRHSRQGGMPFGAAFPHSAWSRKTSKIPERAARRDFPAPRGHAPRRPLRRDPPRRKDCASGGLLFLGDDFVLEQQSSTASSNRREAGILLLREKSRNFSHSSGSTVDATCFLLRWTALIVTFSFLIPARPQKYRPVSQVELSPPERTVAWPYFCFRDYYNIFSRDMQVILVNISDKEIPFPSLTSLFSPCILKPEGGL